MLGFKCDALELCQTWLAIHQLPKACEKRWCCLGCCLEVVVYTLFGGEWHMEDFEHGAMSNNDQHACVIAAVNTSRFNIGDVLECWEQVGLCSYGVKVSLSPIISLLEREMDCCCSPADANALLRLASLARV